MVKKMLIDATHAEETRVVVVDGTRLEEFDVETSTKKQLKGNIYLAKVIRVEPSLQAAFVDYGNERHGFLPFSEIHPDYYQIPVADREALKESLMEQQRANALDDDEMVEEQLKYAEENGEEDDEGEMTEYTEPRRHCRHSRDNCEVREAAPIETVNGGEGDDSGKRSHRNSYYDLIRKYKIQEVIHRNQILLVQITKEERGNKGAALTTYLSLAGRYCVLMPNNARGGGVSRKITNIADRHKLKDIVNDLPVPDGMSVIVRTAGRERNKAEIKRDYEYLIKTWIQIRDMTMASVAPSLIHEEGDLIRRSVRDIYSPDISEIIIEGDTAYKTTKDFIKMIIPSHLKKVTNYTDNIPLFQRFQIETQLEALHSPIVQLRSGGYLVIDPTEALVAIDVNSGRATKERNIEDTALKTNLEAVEEVARQLRLRDLAGLVVIDLIDMEETRNNYAVERKMKEMLRKDKARVQMSRINGFGLMEISRQRLHSSFIETSYHVCPCCQGKGVVRSTESIAVHLLRVLEEEGVRQRSNTITMTVPSNIALYILNHKREALAEMERIYDIKIVIEGDDSFVSPTDYRIERTKKVVAKPEGRKPEDIHSSRRRALVEEPDAEDEKQSSQTEDDDTVTDKDVEETAKEDTSSEEEENTFDDENRPHRRGRRGLFGRWRNRRSHRRDYDGDREGKFSDAATSSEEPVKEESSSMAEVKTEEKSSRRNNDFKRRGSSSKSLVARSEEATALVKVGDAPVPEVKKPVKGAVILFSSSKSHKKKAEETPTPVAADTLATADSAPKGEKTATVKADEKPAKKTTRRTTKKTTKKETEKAVKAVKADKTAKAEPAPVAEAEKEAKPKGKKNGWWGK